MSTVSPAELAERVRSRGLRCDARLSLSFLRDWETRGIAEEHLGRWRLTHAGAAMFGGWAAGVDGDGQEPERVAQVSLRTEILHGRGEFRVLGGDEERAA